MSAEINLLKSIRFKQKNTAAFHLVSILKHPLIYEHYNDLTSVPRAELNIICKMLRNIEEFSGIKESKYGRHISNK